MPDARRNVREVKAPTGNTLNCASWPVEAAFRMIQNNLDSEVAENPAELVVYGGIGKAARTWNDFDRILGSLKRLREDETLLVQSGRPVGVFRTHAYAPRVLIANSNIVPHWANWDKFHELDRKGLMMYGQMTAGSWIYIGTQGIVQGTYETFAEASRRHYDGRLRGKWILTAGLGGMGGAQPLAAVMAGACCLAVECNPDSIEFRLKTGYLDEWTESLDSALAMIENWTKAGQAKSVGLLGNAADVFPELYARGVRPDIVTDQTAAHDTVNGYLPQGWTLAQWRAMRATDPKGVEAAARASIRTHVAAMVDFWNAGVPTLDYGNNIRQVALDEGLSSAFAFPGFVPAYIRPLFCRGVGPFRWVALSGDPEDIYRTDRAVKEILSDNGHLCNWLDMARERIRFQGLPARICWVGLGDRHRLGLAFNELVRTGEGVRANRDWPRPPGFGVGCVSQPRDRGDARRLGRRFGLASSERVAEHRVWSHMGVRPPWRRRGDRVFPARRNGRCGGRHGRCGTEVGEGFVERSRFRRHAACRRWLRGSHCLREGSWPESSRHLTEVLRTARVLCRWACILPAWLAWPVA